MYRKSFFLVLLSLLLMGIVMTGSRFLAAIPGISGLPSSYDPKITVEEAAKTSEKPLLIEFYADTCSACRLMTPWVHKLSEKYKNDVTFVMVNTDDTEQAPIAQIFGIQYIPAIFVFDFHHMAKAQIAVDDYKNISTLDKAIDSAIAQVKKDGLAKSKKM